MTRLGKYELLKEIGRGGFGIVHLAQDTSLDIQRAVKVLHPLLNSDPSFIQRFRREARVVARMRHPNIIPVYDLGQAEGWIYLVMEYMPGGSLKARLKEGPVPYPKAVQILAQIGEGLAYAHRQDIVHRDVKPENVLFDEMGTAQIGDFGFARSLMDADTSTTLSLTGGAMGTPAYMAPEAWDGLGWTPAADIYSLACVFVEMLTGTVLFDSNSPVQAMKKHVIDGPDLPEHWPEGVPEGIGRVISTALAKEAENRYQDVREFVQAIQGLTGGPASAPAPAEARPAVEKPPEPKISAPREIEHPAEKIEEETPIEEPPVRVQAEPEVEKAAPAPIVREEQPAAPAPASRPVQATISSSGDVETVPPARSRRSLLILLAPGVFLLLLNFVYPLLQTLVLSFQYRSLFDDYGAFVGLENYFRILTYSENSAALLNLVLLLVGRLVAVRLAWRVLEAAWRQGQIVPTRVVMAASASIPFLTTIGMAIALKTAATTGYTMNSSDWLVSEPTLARIYITLADAAVAFSIASSIGLLCYALIQRRSGPGTEAGQAPLQTVKNLSILIAAASSFLAIYPELISPRFFDVIVNRIFEYQFAEQNLGPGAALAVITTLCLGFILFLIRRTWKRSPLKLQAEAVSSPDPDLSLKSSRRLLIPVIIGWLVVLLSYGSVLYTSTYIGREAICSGNYNGWCSWSWSRWFLNNLLWPGLVICLVQIPIAVSTAYALVIRLAKKSRIRRITTLLIAAAALLGMEVFAGPIFINLRNLIPFVPGFWRYALLLFSAPTMLLMFFFMQGESEWILRKIREGRTEWQLFREEVLPRALPLILLAGTISLYLASQSIRTAQFSNLPPDYWNAGKTLLVAYYDSFDWSGTAAAFVPITVFPLAIPAALALALLVRVIIRRFSLGIQAPEQHAG